MPRDDTTTIGDLVDRLNALRVIGEKCVLAGRHRLNLLIEREIPAFDFRRHPRTSHR